MPSDRTELMVRQVRPDPPGHGNGVDRTALPVFDPVALDQGEKHVDVETHVVRGDRPLRQIGPDLRPQLAKIGSVRHVPPADSVNVGEIEPFGRWADQPVPPFDDNAVLNDRQPELAGAVHQWIGGLKVDGGEIWT